MKKSEYFYGKFQEKERGVYLQACDWSVKIKILLNCWKLTPFVCCMCGFGCVEQENN